MEYEVKYMRSFIVIFLIENSLPCTLVFILILKLLPVGSHRVVGPLLFLQGVSIACYAEPCISYGRVVCPSVCPSVHPSVHHTLALSQNDANSSITKSIQTDIPRTSVVVKTFLKNSRPRPRPWCLGHLGTQVSRPRPRPWS